MPLLPIPAPLSTVGPCGSWSSQRLRSAVPRAHGLKETLANPVLTQIISSWSKPYLKPCHGEGQGTQGLVTPGPTPPGPATLRPYEDHTRQ